MNPLPPPSGAAPTTSYYPHPPLVFDSPAYAAQGQGMPQGQAMMPWPPLPAFAGSTVVTYSVPYPAAAWPLPPPPPTAVSNAPVSPPQSSAVQGSLGATSTPHALVSEDLAPKPAQQQRQQRPGTTISPNMQRTGEHPSDFAKGRQVIVNFLAPEVTSAHLIDVFSTIGPLETARIIFDKETGVSRQFGFVYFIRPEDAQRAVHELTGYSLLGRKIKVTVATTQR